MAKIVDPDFLSQGSEVEFNTDTRTISVLPGENSNIDGDGITLKALWSFCKEEWNTDDELGTQDFPISEDSYQLLRDGAIVDGDNIYTSITSLGNFDLGQPYYIQGDGVFVKQYVIRHKL